MMESLCQGEERRHERRDNGRSAQKSSAGLEEGHSHDENDESMLPPTPFHRRVGLEEVATFLPPSPPPSPPSSAPSSLPSSPTHTTTATPPPQHTTTTAAPVPSCLSPLLPLSKTQTSSRFGGGKVTSPSKLETCLGFGFAPSRRKTWNNEKMKNIKKNGK